MEKSEMFKEAHKIARNTVEVVGNYSIAFKLALKTVWLAEKASKKEVNFHQATVMMTCSIFAKKRRIYGIPESISDEKIYATKKELEPLWLDGKLSDGQTYYAVWCRILGKKAVDRWIELA